MKLTASILLAAACSAAAAEPSSMPPSPDLGRAYVSIPYTELRALWEAGQKKVEPVPVATVAPIPFLVNRADMRLQLGEGAGSMDAEFDVELLGKEWQRVPLLGGEVRLADGGQSSVIWEDGYTLLGQAPGKMKVALHLVTKGSRELSGGGVLKLKLGRASVKRLMLAGVPAGIRVNLSALCRSGGLCRRYSPE